MSKANAQFDASLEFLYQAFGSDCVYTDRDGNTSTVQGIVREDLGRFGEVAEVSKATATVTVRTCEMDRPPRRSETYTVGDQVYVIGDLVDSDDLEHTVLVA